MIYPVVEMFDALQGEGIHTGRMMTFCRFRGCSVGKKVCHFCDTSFERILPWYGGGDFHEEYILDRAGRTGSLCLTGGEPFDHDLTPILHGARQKLNVFIETSGTVPIPDVFELFWLTVSPKPGWRADALKRADEVKVLVPAPEGFPTLGNALDWACEHKIVYLQPINDRYALNQNALKMCIELIKEHPILRLSVQMQKVIGSR